MGLLYFINKKFLRDYDAVNAWVPIQLLRSTDRLPQYLKQALCYWKSPHPQNIVSSFLQIIINTEGARTSEVVETKPPLNVESMNATTPLIYTQLLFRLSSLKVSLTLAQRLYEIFSSFQPYTES
jgi:hypothetical protein